VGFLVVNESATYCTSLSELARRQGMAWATGNKFGQEVEDNLIFDIEYFQICVGEILNFSKTKERKCSVQTPTSLLLML
jgi:hypothetical protein